MDSRVASEHNRGETHDQSLAYSQVGKDGQQCRLPTQRPDLEERVETVLETSAEISRFFILKFCCLLAVQTYQDHGLRGGQVASALYLPLVPRVLWE